jgi:uncharacterized membrane protein
MNKKHVRMHFVKPASPAEKELSQLKESPTRSLTKALTYRVLAAGATFLISFVIFRQMTDKRLSEVVESATYITILEFVAKVIVYYIHERLWTNIKWGKYWKRQYWERRAWKRLYRKMHQDSPK